MNSPFDIPAINNEFEVLALFLGIADDNDLERTRIEVLGMKDGISKFKFNGDLYSVALNRLLRGNKIAYEFNSSWYSIQKEETSVEIRSREGAIFPLNRPQQVWYGDTPLLMQTAWFAGQEMMAITDDAGAFDLDYLGHISSGFASMEEAKAAAPTFARGVLERLRNLIQDA